MVNSPNLTWDQLISFSVHTVEGEYGYKHPFWKNPTKQELDEAMPRLQSKYSHFPHFRGVLDHKSGEAYVWPSETMDHEQFIQRAGLDHKNVRHIWLNQHSKEYGLPLGYGPNTPHTLRLTTNAGGVGQASADKQIKEHPWVKKMGMDELSGDIKTNEASIRHLSGALDIRNFKPRMA